VKVAYRSPKYPLALLRSGALLFVTFKVSKKLRIQRAYECRNVHVQFARGKHLPVLEHKP